MPGRPPSEWASEMVEKIKKDNPDYTDEQARSTMGAIWHKNLSESKKQEITKRKEGKLRVCSLEEGMFTLPVEILLQLDSVPHGFSRDFFGDIGSSYTGDLRDTVVNVDMPPGYVKLNSDFVIGEQDIDLSRGKTAVDEMVMETLAENIHSLYPEVEILDMKVTTKDMSIYDKWASKNLQGNLRVESGFEEVNVPVTINKIKYDLHNGIEFIIEGTNPDLYDEQMKDYIGAVVLQDESAIEAFRKAGYTDEEISSLFDEARSTGRDVTYGQSYDEVDLPKPVTIDVGINKWSSKNPRGVDITSEAKKWLEITKKVAQTNTFMFPNLFSSEAKKWLEIQTKLEAVKILGGVVSTPEQGLKAIDQAIDSISKQLASAVEPEVKRIMDNQKDKILDEITVSTEQNVQQPAPPIPPNAPPAPAPAVQPAPQPAPEAAPVEASASTYMPAKLRVAFDSTAKAHGEVRFGEWIVCGLEDGSNEAIPSNVIEKEILEDIVKSSVKEASEGKSPSFDLSGSILGDYTGLSKVSSIEVRSGYGTRVRSNSGESPWIVFDKKADAEEFLDEVVENPAEKFTIYVGNNMGENKDGTALIWTNDVENAKLDQSIAGEGWEFDGEDFAYARVSDSPTLIQDLEKDGYNVEDDEYWSWSSWEELQETLSDEYKVQS